jgi:hypothetical protein
LKAASAFMFLLVQSEHLARPTTTGAVSPCAASARPMASTTAQTPNINCRGRNSMVELYHSLGVAKERESCGWM